MTRVCHVTSVHPRDDIRIFHKECVSLSEAGYAVTLLVADGRGPETKGGVTIVDAGKRSNRRVTRMTRTLRRMRNAALSLDSDLYHLHDPELLLLVPGLSKNGKKVIFDAHEDLPKQILAKTYIPRLLRKSVSRWLAWLEINRTRRTSGVITSTDIIKQKFLIGRVPAVAVCNYPLLSEVLGDEGSRQETQRTEICYVGSISRSRGIVPLVQALGLVRNQVKMCLAGHFENPETKAWVSGLGAWNLVDFRGYLNREEIVGLLRRAFAGLVTLLPTPSYVESMPIKLFEYMGAGLPVIASDFPLWRDIVEGRNCGICVDPHKAHEIANAIDWLHEHPEEAQRMGENGRQAVLQRFNWGSQEKKLVAFYKRVLGEKQ